MGDASGAFSPDGGRERSEQGGARPALAGIRIAHRSRRKAACPPLLGRAFLSSKKGGIFPPFFFLKALKALKALSRAFLPYGPKG